MSEPSAVHRRKITIPKYQHDTWRNEHISLLLILSFVVKTSRNRQDINHDKTNFASIFARTYHFNVTGKLICSELRAYNDHVKFTCDTLRPIKMLQANVSFFCANYGYTYFWRKLCFVERLSLQLPP